VTRKDRSDLLQGTLDMLVLKSLQLGALHGWGITERIESASRHGLQLNQGSMYPALTGSSAKVCSAPSGARRRRAGARATTRSPQPVDRSWARRWSTGSASTKKSSHALNAADAEILRRFDR
jgi:DNA-binding IclR family transcriptional regulator